MANTRPLHSAQPIAARPTGRTSERTLERGSERATDRVTEKRLERPDMRRLTDDGRFSIDLNSVPPGMVMEWKRHQIMGMEDKRNQVTIRQFHWEPVTHKTQPHILGHLCKNEDEHIMVDGMGLYMRPIYLNKEAEAENRSETDYVLGQQLKSLTGSSKEQVGPGNTYFKKQSIPVPQAIE